MYIATNDEMTPHHNIINILPRAIKLGMYNINLDEATEIRLMQGKPMFIRYPDGDYFITHKGRLSRDATGGVVIRKKHIDEVLEKITNSSLYSVVDEIKNGYITIDGGHRVGLAGTAVTDGGTVGFIKNISAINIRIASEVVGCSDKLMDAISNGGIKNTLIISPPGCGKTTLLRDIARNISDAGLCVGIADERCEIAAMHNGESAFDIGTHATVLENCPKPYAMMTLLRSMSPDVIITDELGTDEDADAVSKMINSGVGVIASAHGRDIARLQRREVFKKLLGLFEVAVIMSKREGVGTIEEVIDLGERI